MDASNNNLGLRFAELFLMRYIIGDLIKLVRLNQVESFGHGCNCFNTMGSGIASQIRENFPTMYMLDQNTRSGDKAKLGRAMPILLPNGVWGFNLYTQYAYGGRALHINLDALKVTLNAACDILEPLGVKTMHIPKIGSGLGNGNWDAISMSIKSIERKRKIEFIVVCYEPIESRPKRTYKL